MLNTSHVASIWNLDPNYSLPNVTQVSLPKMFQIVATCLVSIHHGRVIVYRCRELFNQNHASLSQRLSWSWDYRVLASLPPIFLAILSYDLSSWFLDKKGKRFHGFVGFKAHWYWFLNWKIIIHISIVFSILLFNFYDQAFYFLVSWNRSYLKNFLQVLSCWKYIKKKLRRSKL